MSRKKMNLEEIKLCKGTLEYYYKCAKGEYSDSNFDDEHFRRVFIKSLDMAGHYACKARLEEFRKDSKELNIKDLILKYIDVQPDEYDQIIEETTKEFLQELDAQLRAEEYIENRQDYKLPWEEKE